MHLVRRVVVAALAVGAVWPVSNVSAHAGLESSIPAASSVLEASPENVVLDFDEAIESRLASIQLFDSHATALEVGAPHAPAGDDTVVLASLPTLDPGLYAIVWRVTSVDGHVVDGAFSFQIGTGAVGDGGALVDEVLNGARPDPVVTRLANVGRFLAFLGLVALVGGGGWALVWSCVDRRRSVVLIVVGWVAAVAGTAIAFVAQAATALGGDASDLVSPDAWRQMASTDTGRLMLARLTVLAVMAVLIELRRARETAWWRSAVLVGAVALVATHAAAGHPRAMSPRALWTLNDGVHLASVTIWLGGLIAMAVGAIDPDGPDRRELVGRFSVAATVTIPIIIVTGTAQTWKLAGGFGQVTESDWGRVLLIKASIVSVLVAIGAVSRWMLLNDGTGTLRRLITIEAALGVVVLALAANLVSLPPRPVAEAQVFTATLTEAGTIVDVTVTPGHVGANEMHVIVTPAGGSLQPVTSVSARMALPERDIPRIPVDLVADGANHYSGDVTLIFAGTWTLDIVVDVTPGNSLLLTTEVPIP